MKFQDKPILRTDQKSLLQHPECFDVMLIFHINTDNAYIHD